jgi:hypothetical protein
MDAEQENQGSLVRGIFRLFLNCLTIVLLLATVGVACAYALVFVNPYVGFNRYPPPTLPPTLGPPTVTPTPDHYLPTAWTPTPTFTPIPTNTPTATPVPTDTPTPTPIDRTASPTPTGAPFAVQTDSPTYLKNSGGFVNDQECKWMGVGGQVFDLSGNPIKLQAVHLEGQLAGLPMSMDSLTGSAAKIGEAGYLFNLSDHPIASEGTLSLQLRDTAGLPLSEKYAITTYESCEKNLLVVNWRQVR